MQIRFALPMRLLAGALLLAGCASKPTQGGRTLSLGKFAGDGQIGSPSGPVSTLPAVRILDEKFEPVPDVSVTFTVASGGGILSGGTAVTDADGVARVGGWSLGPNPGPNTLKAAVVGGAVGSPATFLASAVAPGGGTKPGGGDQ